MSEIMTKGKAAKAASYIMNEKSTQEKNEALEKIAQQLLLDKEYVIAENQKDLEQGKAKGLSDSVLDRIMLNEKRIEDMAAAIRLLIE